MEMLSLRETISSKASKKPARIEKVARTEERIRGREILAISSSPGHDLADGEERVPPSKTHNVGRSSQEVALLRSI